MRRSRGQEVVAWRSWVATYPDAAPWNPAESELGLPGEGRSHRPNHVYTGVSECFRLAGLDGAHDGTPDWNPLGDLIAPGETVLLKPNWVKAEHPRLERAGQADAWHSVVTHPSIVRAVADYCFRAIGPTGRVIVADAPQTDSSWALLERRLELAALRDHYAERGLHFEILDLRREEWETREGVVTARRALAGDPRGYVAVDLGERSEFQGHAGMGRYYGADYDDREVNRHHSGGRHEYLVSRTALEADVVFSLPKLKTHKKTGLTAGLKNLVGVNGDKNWLPHHTEPDWRGRGGDERPTDLPHRPAQIVERQAARWVRRLTARFPGLEFVHRPARRAGMGLFGSTDRVVRSGNWWGNDTCWRMCLDLNKIILYADADGRLRKPGPAGRKRYFVLADGIVAGHRNGPMDPDPLGTGLLLFGTHPASVDATAAVLMGFDPDCLPIVHRAFEHGSLPLVEWSWRDVALMSNDPDWNCLLPELPLDSSLNFEPHFAWKGHVERNGFPSLVRVPLA